MNRRIIILIHATAAVLLQAIPNTIVTAVFTVYGTGYQTASFFDMGHLWGSGMLFAPPATLCSVAALLFALLYFLRGNAWERITVLVLHALTLAFLSFPIYLMLADLRRFSLVILLIAVLSLMNLILCAVPERKKAV